MEGNTLTVRISAWRILILFLSSLLTSLLVSPLATAYAADRTLSVGVYQNEPLIFTNEQGQADGLYVDVLEEIADRLDLNLTYSKNTFSENLDLLESGKIDIMTAIAYSNERAQRFDFNEETILANWGRVFCAPDRQIESILDMEGLRLAIIPEDIYSQEFQRLARGFQVAVEYVETQNYATALATVQRGHADAALVSRIFGAREKSQYDVVETKVIIKPIELRLAFPKGKDPSLIRAIDYELRTSKGGQEPILNTATDKWLSDHDDQGNQEIARYLIWSLAIVSAITALLSMAVAYSRWQVRARTTELEETNANLQREVSERREAEEERSQLFNAVEQSAETIIITDPSGIMIYVNPAFTNVTGYSRSRSLGLELHFFQQGDKDIEPYAELVRTVSGGEVWTGRLDDRRQDGSTFLADVTVTPVKDDTGNITNHIVSSREITHMAELEKQLLQSQKLEAVGLLTGGLAHDFNNILASILGHAEILLEDLPEGSELNQNARVIKLSVNRGASLIRQLLAFARLQVMHPHAIDLNAGVEATKSMLAGSLGDHFVLDVDLDPDMKKVYADPGQIEMAIVNLVLNARDAMPQGGTISVRTVGRKISENYHPQGEVKQPPLPPGEYALITIRDSGEGMNEETQKHLFEPFYTTKPDGEGSGLGLATVYGIVQQSGGEILVESELGKGSVFSVFLPVVEEDEESTHEPGTDMESTTSSAPDAFQADGKVVLLAEDEESLRRLLARQLERAGFTVFEAGSGAEAEVLYTDSMEQIDILLTDVTMPGMTGVELAQRLRGHEPTLPVILISGYSVDKLSQISSIPGGVSLLEKPFTFEALVKEVRAALGISSPPSSTGI